jgi:hypothetical protein
MIKKTVIALVAAASFAGVVAPAMADTGAFGDGSPEMREFTADSILSSLQNKGVNATSVEEWGGLVRAYVKLDNGAQAMQLFVPGSLEQVTL